MRSKSSRRKHREILRYVYALTGVVAVSATIVTAAVLIEQAAEDAMRLQLERFHFASVTLASEASNRSARLEREVEWLIEHVSADAEPAVSIAAHRRVATGVRSVGATIDEIVELHRGDHEPAAPMHAAIERAERQIGALLELAQPDHAERATLPQRIGALQITLIQLRRLHGIAAGELLSRLNALERRTVSRTGVTVAVVLLVAALIAIRLMQLLRTRLHEHEQTERNLRDRERQLHQASKLEALGALVGGVSHDFNNLLTAILCNVESLQSELGPADPGQTRVREIQNASERAAALTRQMLAFSRQQAVESNVVDLKLLIRDVEPMLRRLIRSDIDLQLRLSAEACHADVDTVQIEQVLINLAVNAGDAIEGSGTLRIESSIVRLDAGDRDGIALEPGEYVRIRVEDSGCGMSPETVSRMFDPFFTTKDQGKGTGLGLSTVHGVVGSVGGRVSVDSELGTGTRIDVLLPRCDAPAIVETHRSVPQTGAARSEVVLVAEDEPQVRRLVVDGLRSAGYRVLQASDGEEALRRCAEQPPGSIDLILSDVVMPGMRGPEMVERARAIQPRARVLFMSGYNEDLALGRESGRGAPLLTKPFKLRQLLETVRREIATGRGARETVEAG